MDTIGEAVEWAIKQTSESDRVLIKERLANGESPADVAGLGHHGFGTFLRNELRLWHPGSAALRQSVWDSLTPERQAFYEGWWKGMGDHRGSSMHADDASHAIMTEAVKRIGSL